MVYHWSWFLSELGFNICYLLIYMPVEFHPSDTLVWLVPYLSNTYLSKFGRLIKNSRLFLAFLIPFKLDFDLYIPFNFWKLLVLIYSWTYSKYCINFLSFICLFLLLSLYFIYSSFLCCTKSILSNRCCICIIWEVFNYSLRISSATNHFLKVS